MLGFQPEKKVGKGTLKKTFAGWPWAMVSFFFSGQGVNQRYRISGVENSSFEPSSSIFVVFQDVHPPFLWVVKLVEQIETF